DGIILLAPSVPSGYDLRPALRSTRRGVVVFCSHYADWYLRVGLALTNTLCGRRFIAAGTVGFCPIIQSPGDAAGYAKLVHYPWSPLLAWTGHEGGHFGCYQQGYLRTFVLPLLLEIK